MICYFSGTGNSQRAARQIDEECGGRCGNAAPYAEKRSGRRGLRFHGLAEALMPENDLALFPTPDKAEAKRILAASVPQTQTPAEAVEYQTKSRGRPRYYILEEGSR